MIEKNAEMMIKFTLRCDDCGVLWGGYLPKSIADMVMEEFSLIHGNCAYSGMAQKEESSWK